MLDLLEDVIDFANPKTFWKWMVGFGCSVLLIGIVTMLVGNSIKAPEDVLVNGARFTCEQVRAESKGLVGLLASGLSEDFRDAQTQCARASVSKLLVAAGMVITVVSGLWTFGWWMAGQKTKEKVLAAQREAAAEAAKAAREEARKKRELREK